jgi:hypothetical protein
VVQALQVPLPEHPLHTAAAVVVEPGFLLAHKSAELAVAAVAVTALLAPQQHLQAQRQAQTGWEAVVAVLAL